MFHFFKTDPKGEDALPKKTEDLLKELSTVADMKEYLAENAEEFVTKDFFGLLEEYTARRGYDKSEMAQLSGLDRFYVYEIYRGRKLPTADKIVALALALTLTLEETQHLLMTAARPVLYAKKKRDSILIFAINNKKTVVEANALLYEAGEALLSE